tara:strand:- start:479 stop:1186 length:708 start_codon:yes stop_codon:yes gene_type:complete
MDHHFSLGAVIKVGMEVIQKHGWTSVGDAKKRNGSVICTADHVKDILTAYQGPFGNANLWTDCFGSSETYTTDVLKVIDFVNHLTPPRGTTRTGLDYYERLQALYDKETVGTKDIGMVISALSFFNNPRMSQERYREMIEDSEHFGTLRNRDEFFVKLLKDSYLTGKNCYVYKFITRHGNLGFFFKNDKLSVSPGECFLFKGTPIEHTLDNYDKVPITKFNRVVFLENHGKPNSP